MQKEQILTNVIMLVPVGVLVGWIWRWRGLWAAAGLSIFIEILQLITARGLCEFDDVIHNCLGAVIRILALKIVAFVRKKKDAHNEYSFYWSGQKN